MMIELKPEQEQILQNAVKSGMTQEEVLDQAFAIIGAQFPDDDWMLAERDAIRAQIEEGFAQAERGELIDADEAMRMLRERRAKRNVA